MQRSRALLVLLLACSDPANDPDAGADARPDASPIDSSELDAEPSDADPPDAGDPFGPVTIDLDAPAPETLSSFNLVRLRNGELEYNEGIFPYELNTALFSDYAIKKRAIYVPPGTKIQFRSNEAFEFPVGSAIIKSFLFD